MIAINITSSATSHNGEVIIKKRVDESFLIEVTALYDFLSFEQRVPEQKRSR